MSVKRVFVMTTLVVGCIGLLGAQSYYDDDIYYNPSKETKKASAKVETTKSAVADYPSADTYSVHNPYTMRDVDEYNRRTPQSVDSATMVQDEDFEYTRRIERFYDPQVVSQTGDPELVEYYYSSAQPEVNIIVGASSYDPWLWNWGWNWSWNWGSPYYYSHWGWNSWYWGYPYYPYSYGWWGPGWYNSWYYSFYHPSFYPYPGHYPGPGYHGGGNHRWANGSPGGWSTTGARPGGNGRYSGERGIGSRGGGYAPAGNSGTLPSDNTGYRSGNRRGVSTWQNSAAPRNENSGNSRSYNSNSGSSNRSSGFSSGSRGSSSRGGFSSGGGGGRGGRR